MTEGTHATDGQMSTEGGQTGTSLDDPPAGQKSSIKKLKVSKVKGKVASSNVRSNSAPPPVAKPLRSVTAESVVTTPTSLDDPSGPPHLTIESLDDGSGTPSRTVGSTPVGLGGGQFGWVGSVCGRMRRCW